MGDKCAVLCVEEVVLDLGAVKLCRDVIPLRASQVSCVSGLTSLSGSGGIVLLQCRTGGYKAIRHCRSPARVHNWYSIG